MPALTRQLICTIGLMIFLCTGIGNADPNDYKIRGSVSGITSEFNKPAASGYIESRLSDRNRINDNDLEYQDLVLESPNGSIIQDRDGHPKRSGPSLSIVNSIDVLRQRLLLEMARRQMEKSQLQIAENRKLMESIGKRTFQHSHFPKVLDYNNI